MCNNEHMAVREIIIRLLAAFVYAFSGYIVAAAVLDVTAWKAAVMSAGFVILDIVRKLAGSYADGKLTFKEINEAFKRGA